MNLSNDTSGGGCGEELMGTFGVVMQMFLALIAFSTLILKRLTEPVDRRRKWRIWFADSAKQGLAATLIHFLNIGFAKLSDHDQCTWYFINYLLDSTVGLFIIFVLLKLIGRVADCRGWTALKSGDYGQKFNSRWWLAQCTVYLLIALVEKFIIIIMLQIPFWDEVAKRILPIPNARVKDAIVIVVVPFVVNVIMFWVVDSILMSKWQRNKFKGTVKYYKNEDDLCDPEDEVLLDELLSNQEEPRPDYTNKLA
ncbi:store-operated calcium entry regulator STIMATE-like [Corticium candelabrum]|uniref:store-operated calcium entry regulator STIMATE-like n=1 Tax=Corticium candelabrum TaxID=121492 RepID=UPI002E26D05B|nr:store-operated calcium entry regulator STIMATE-like [Corticium candelabrum]